MKHSDTAEHSHEHGEASMRRGRPTWIAAGIACAVLGSIPVAIAQQDNDSEGETSDCIDLMSIDRTEVIGDDTILFYMRNDEVFRNDLQASCPGLKFDERFMYEVSTSRLCSVDVVSLLTDAGFGFRRGASCNLGEFEPISKEAAERLSEEAERE